MTKAPSSIYCWMIQKQVDQYGGVRHLESGCGSINPDTQMRRATPEEMVSRPECQLCSRNSGRSLAQRGTPGAATKQYEPPQCPRCWQHHAGECL